MKIYAFAVLTNIAQLCTIMTCEERFFCWLHSYLMQNPLAAAFSAYGFQLKRMYDYHTYGSYVQHPFEPQRKVSVCLTQGAAMQQYRQ